MRNKQIENGVMLQGFEWYLSADASLWNTLKNKAAGLAKRGVTSIWLPPAYKGHTGKEDVGYGVYDVYDLGEFDQKGSVPTKYGTKEEYIACIEAFQENGVDVYADIVLNHMMGADDVEEVDAVENFRCDRTEDITPEQTIQAWTQFTFPGRNGKYSDFTWDWTCFSGVDWDERLDKGGIYRFKGSEWDPGVDRENANFDYLMGANIKHSNPRVREQLKTWGQWYLDTTHVDGFRLDAVKHIANDFYADWLGTLRSDNQAELFAVGEYWHPDVNILEEFLSSCDRSMSLFDVPLHFNFFDCSHSNGNFDMRHLLDGTLVQKDPLKAVTFVNNHDTQRGQALESAVLEWFVPLAYAVILLRPQGYPCVFYGDYYGVSQYNAEGFPAELDIMTYLRRTRLYGEQHDYLDHPDIIGWTLEGDEKHPNSGLAVVMTNRLGGEKHMYVGTQHAGEIWLDAMGICTQAVVIDDNGYGCFTCANGSLSIWTHGITGTDHIEVERFDDAAALRQIHRPQLPWDVQAE